MHYSLLTRHQWFSSVIDVGPKLVFHIVVVSCFASFNVLGTLGEVTLVFGHRPRPAFKQNATSTVSLVVSAELTLHRSDAPGIPLYRTSTLVALRFVRASERVVRPLRHTSPTSFASHGFSMGCNNPKINRVVIIQHGLIHSFYERGKESPRSRRWVSWLPSRQFSRELLPFLCDSLPVSRSHFYSINRIQLQRNL